MSFDSFIRSDLGDFIESPLGDRQVAADRDCGERPDSTELGSCCITAFGRDECLDTVNVDQCRAMGGRFRLAGTCIDRFICTPLGDELGACCTVCKDGETRRHLGFCANRSEADCRSQEGVNCQNYSGEQSTFATRWWGRGTRCIPGVHRCMNEHGLKEAVCVPSHGLSGFRVYTYAIDDPLSPELDCCGTTDTPFFGPHFCSAVSFALRSRVGIESIEHPFCISTSTLPFSEIELITAKRACQESIDMGGINPLDVLIGPRGKLCTANPIEFSSFDYYFTCDPDIDPPGSCCLFDRCVDATQSALCESLGGRKLPLTESCFHGQCPPLCCVSRNICIDNLDPSNCSLIGGDVGEEEFERCFE